MPPYRGGICSISSRHCSRILEGHRQHHAVLSLDVAGQKPRNSFGPLRAWADRVARESVCEAHEATGESLIYLFPAEECALRTARRLIEGLPQFNAEQGWSATPLQSGAGLARVRLSWSGARRRMP